MPASTGKLDNALARLTAAKLLQAGKLVVAATDTLYGLLADAGNEAAIAKVFAAKQRPPGQPLLVLVADLKMARQLAVFSSEAEKLADAFWPGALSLVLPLRKDAPIAASALANQRTIALRCPARADLRSLITEAGMALVAPSANLSKQPAPTCLADVKAGILDAASFALDGGRASSHKPSTLVQLSSNPPKVLREGVILLEDILARLDQDA